MTSFNLKDDSISNYNNTGNNSINYNADNISNIDIANTIINTDITDTLNNNISNDISLNVILSIILFLFNIIVIKYYFCLLLKRIIAKSFGFTDIKKSLCGSAVGSSFSIILYTVFSIANNGGIYNNLTFSDEYYKVLINHFLFYVNISFSNLVISIFIFALCSKNTILLNREIFRAFATGVFLCILCICAAGLNSWLGIAVALLYVPSTYNIIRKIKANHNNISNNNNDINNDNDINNNTNTTFSNVYDDNYGNIAQSNYTVDSNYTYIADLNNDISDGAYITTNNTVNNNENFTRTNNNINNNTSGNISERPASINGLINLFRPLFYSLEILLDYSIVIFGGKNKPHKLNFKLRAIISPFINCLIYALYNGKKLGLNNIGTHIAFATGISIILFVCSRKPHLYNIISGYSLIVSLFIMYAIGKSQASAMNNLICNAINNNYIKNKNPVISIMAALQTGIYNLIIDSFFFSRGGSEISVYSLLINNLVSLTIASFINIIIGLRYKLYIYSNMAARMAIGTAVCLNAVFLYYVNNSKYKIAIDMCIINLIIMALYYMIMCIAKM